MRREAAEIVVEALACVGLPLYYKHFVLVIFGEHSADLGGGILPCREATLEDSLAGVCIVDADATRDIVHRVVAGIDLLNSRLELVKTDGEGRFGALDVAVG